MKITIYHFDVTGTDKTKENSENLFCQTSASDSTLLDMLTIFI